jgi:prolyl-tRNA synthetase
MADKQVFVKEITPKSEDFSRWYQDVIRKAEMADYSMVRGCMVIPPYGFAVWELIQDALDRRLKATGHQNAYFPLFIPKSLLEKEAEHVEGFAPQVAWVTHGGGEELEEPLAVRPTSEAIIGSMYAKWVHSWRDLPILINQWGNVVRWEKVTRPFLRTTEFLWQEGHTVHATEEEAEAETILALETYQDLVENELAIPVITGLKSEQEKFAGALRTYALEALMSDGRALQAGTSHNLGQHFARAFGIQFEDKDQTLKHPWQTSWGVTTRLVGALIMVHGDDSGLILPPRVAPHQVVVVPISIGDWKESVLPHAHEITDKLSAAGVRVKLDDREEYTPGWKYAEWEMRGVPLRLEIGPRDVKKSQVLSVRRDNRAKAPIPWDSIAEDVPTLLDEIQKDLLDKAREFQIQSTTEVSDYDELKRIMDDRRGFIIAPWCGSADCEDQVKTDTTATIRVIPLESKPDGTCVVCNKEGARRVYFAKAY